jgi:hypothetical protein
MCRSEGRRSIQRVFEGCLQLFQQPSGLHFSAPSRLDVGRGPQVAGPSATFGQPASPFQRNALPIVRVTAVRVEDILATGAPNTWTSAQHSMLLPRMQITHFFADARDLVNMRNQLGNPINKCSQPRAKLSNILLAIGYRNPKLVVLPTVCRRCL